MQKYWIIIIGLWVTGCGNVEESQIQAKVNARVSEFVKKKKAECRQGLLREAEKTVDSLLLAEAQMELRDSLNLKRPFKPAQPPAVLPIDSLEVKPIFKKQ